MEKEFIKYEQALALKELGFDEPCFIYTYTGDTGNNINHIIDTKPSLAKNHNLDLLCISHPTFSQAFGWFREKYDLKKEYGVFPHHTIITNYLINGGTEEEAELVCLKELIKIIKNK